MFEGYLADFIARQFGHIISNHEILSVSAWNGGIVLHDVELRKDALDHFEKLSMFEIAFGKIGKLDISIPWSILKSQLLPSAAASTITVVLTNVNVLLTPRRHSKNEKIELSGQEMDRIREQTVQAALEGEILERLASSRKTQQQHKDGWRWRLQERVKDLLSNLSVRIENIHIRYEDPGTCFGFQWTDQSIVYRPPFAFGVTLKQFSIENPSKAESIQYKQATAESLAIYWDSDVQIMAALQNPDYPTLFALMGEKTLSSSGYQTGHVFLLNPFSPSVKFGLSKSSSVSSTMDISLPPCRLALSRTLLEDIGYLRKSVANWKQAKEGLLLPDETLQQLTSLRPNVSATLDPKSWWKYLLTAVKVIVDDRHLEMRRPKGWLGLTSALSRQKRYIQLLERFLLVEEQELEDAHDTLLIFERTLLVGEIVAFRIAAFEHVWKKKDENTPRGKRFSEFMVAAESGDNVDAAPAPKRAIANVKEVLSWEHRYIKFVRLATGLSRQKEYSGNRSDPSEFIEAESRVCWQTTLNCLEVSLQVNDHHRLQISSQMGYTNHQTLALVPIIRLSCGIAQEQKLYHDGSWDMTNRVGSLVVTDCTNRLGAGKSNIGKTTRPYFPNLLGPKGGESIVEDKDSMFFIQGSPFRQSVWVKVQRSKFWDENKVTGSNTKTEIRVLPLEFVYSAAPVEALTHVFDPINDELASDYSRIAKQMSSWRQKQQKRLLQALAHKEKKLHVNVTIGSPVVLLPEGTRPDSSVLVVELGKLSFSDGNPSAKDKNTFDDFWRLKLTNIQVRSASIERCRSPHAEISACEKECSRQLVEPFSIHFDLATKVQSDEVEDGETTVQVLATIPRLAFNITSSTMRLMDRLQRQWELRKKQRLPPSLTSVVETVRRVQSSSTIDVPKRSDQKISDRRKVEFHFQAPLLSLRLENDVSGGRMGTVDETAVSCPLLDVVLKGIEGNLTRESTVAYAVLSFGAKISALGAVDLYQKVGTDFSLLLSSVTPELLNNASQCDFRSFDKPGTVSDLVSVKYEAKTRRVDPLLRGSAQSCADEDLWDDSNVLSVQFNELYVEWNPETLAAISVALLPEEDLFLDEDPVAPPSTGTNVRDNSQEEFFDAEEEAFFDAESEVSESNSRLLSEIAESERSSYANLLVIADEGAPSFQHRIAHLYTSPPLPGSPWSRDKLQVDLPETIADVARKTPLEIAFRLSKLRIHFNKETRCRRLVAAEMANTSFRYRTRRGGGSKTLASIGNLSLSDCEFDLSRTLYREVLGLQCDGGPAGAAASVLEMELIMNPRSRQYTSLDGKVEDPLLENGAPVSVDYASGTVHGFDYYLDARFSPMRFVYLQQLWFEIVDYFFTGVVGSEVWGGVTPIPGDIRVLEGKSIAPEDFSFTRFDVWMESPVVLFPVSSCSTDFIRLEASSIHIRNRYSYDSLRPPTLFFKADDGRNQWYNNCDVTISHMTLHSWSGDALNSADNAPTIRLNLTWPVGPSAPVNVPKWKVICSFDEVCLDLDQPNYSLLQNIVSYNIGDPSHHLDEWLALQALSSLSRDTYLNSIVIHYSYDKKDATPSTFDVKVDIPVVSFLLQHDGNATPSIIRCADVCWRYEKLTDRVSKQTVECNMVVSDTDGTVLLSSCQSLQNTGERGDPIEPDLLYSTMTDPAGSNTKRLQLSEPNIFFEYQEWARLVGFFQRLPEPAFLSPEEAIQVGDRWYKISENSETKEIGTSMKSFSWLDPFQVAAVDHETSTATAEAPTYRFTFSLNNSSVRVQSTGDELVLSAGQIDFFHEGKCNRVVRRLTLSNLELWRGEKENPDLHSTLVQPWGLEAAFFGCNGSGPCLCDSHRLNVDADVVHAKTSYSDLTTMFNSCAKIHRDMHGAKEKSAVVRHDDLESSSRSFDGSSNVVGGRLARPKRRLYSFQLEALLLQVLDDSGRHFEGEQEIVICSVRKTRLSREEHSTDGLAVSSLSTEASCSSVEVLDLLQAKDSPFRHLMRMQPAGSGSERGRNGSCLVVKTAENETTKDYSVELQSLALQYNPSLVVALQRFLGRLKKDVYSMNSDVFSTDPDGMKDFVQGQSASGRSSRMIVRIGAEHLSICLNKEHQGRRLVEVAITSPSMKFERTVLESTLSGQIKNIIGMRPAKNRGFDCADIFLNCLSNDHACVQFKYMTFSQRKVAGGQTPLQTWIIAELDRNPEIDDFVDVRVGVMKLSYVREPFEELADYLSNGMPGKGMGYTSEAAKGFVKTRIQKKSFLSIGIDSPALFVPRAIGSDYGVLCRLGDVNVRSWIAGRSVQENITTRRLSVILTGVAVSISQGSPPGLESNILSKVNFAFEAEGNVRTAEISCKASGLNMILSYSNFVYLLDIFRNNIGKPVDKTKWDNLEVAWERETSKAYSAPVVYSDSARRVRYGQKKTTNSGTSPRKVGITVTADRFSILLKRDDANPAEILYDLALLNAEGIRVEAGQKPDGSVSFNFCLKRVFALDLGRAGRLAVGYQHEAVRFGTNIDQQGSPCVLLDSYTPAADISRSQEGSSRFDSQIELKASRDESETKIVVVVSFLSVTAATLPLGEIVNFFACRWPISNKSGYNTPTTEVTDTVGAVSVDAEKSVLSGGQFRIQFISHYPRIIFPADEYDLHSKAFMVRGLSIANAFYNGSSQETSEQPHPTLTVTSDFQNVSSYMVPDIADLIDIDPARLESPADSISAGRIFCLPQKTATGDPMLQLLLPLTFSVEYEQSASARSIQERHLSVSMDPLSVTLSNEDIQLLKAVSDTWSSTKHERETSMQPLTYSFDAVFHSKRLGLGLRKQNGQIVVDDIAGWASHGSNIQPGDCIYAVNGDPLSEYVSTTLSSVVARLADADRPLTLSFRRQIHDDTDKTDLVREQAAETKQPSLDKLDLTLAEANITLIEKQVPISRVNVKSSKIGFVLSRSEETSTKLSFSSSVECEYFNIRIWGWEPFVEPCLLFLSLSNQTRSDGPSELAIEMGDQGDGLSVNLTDSFCEVLSKLLEWIREDGDDNNTERELVLSTSYSNDGSESHDERGNNLVSRQAANAAYRFASRQQGDLSKPFLVRNVTGVSLAFAQQHTRPREQETSRRVSFVGIGDYPGIQDFEPSEVEVLGNNEELSFQADLVHSTLSDRNARDAELSLPSLTLALQEISGVSTDAIRDVPIGRTGTSSYPLSFSTRSMGSIDTMETKRSWLTWTVERADEKTVLTVGSSIRVVSFVEYSMELAVTTMRENVDDINQIDPTHFRSLGIIRVGEPFCLPLWLALKQRSWVCSARLVDGSIFSPLFSVSASGLVEIVPLVASCVECKGRDEADTKYLAISSQDEDGTFTLAIEAPLCLRNLLPLGIDWEVRDSKKPGVLTDGSTQRRKKLGGTQLLESGYVAEILTKGLEPVELRLRLGAEFCWSVWIMLDAATMRNSKSKSGIGPLLEEGLSGKDRPVTLVHTGVSDPFGIPCTLTLRVLQKTTGLDITIHTDIWFTDATSLNICMGSTISTISEPIVSTEKKRDPLDVSAAKATLDEISSLFESGDGGIGLRQPDQKIHDSMKEIVRLPGQEIVSVTEECFEYLEIEYSTIKRRWWASEDPLQTAESVPDIDRKRHDFRWLEKAWNVDTSGMTLDGWESSPTLTGYSKKREFSPVHRYRRRRWRRKRTGLREGSLVRGVNAFCHLSDPARPRSRDNNLNETGIRVAFRIGGGKWSVSSMLPRRGAGYGVVRLFKSRWPETLNESPDSPEAKIFELCYSISPLEGDWGLFTRSLLITSRFLLRNDSASTTFEVKQTGVNDSWSILLPPGATAPFHWVDFRVPELVSVRPFHQDHRGCMYSWSGGFDPLTIGSIPLRVRQNQMVLTDYSILPEVVPAEVRTIRAEIEIRTRTGGTGISISFQEEDLRGIGALFRVENLSPFPLWICQDGVLSNPSDDANEELGDLLTPYDSLAFSLDVPFRQGKYSHRKAEPMTALLRARVALAPLASRYGAETTKVVSLSVPEGRVVLHPSELSVLPPEIRSRLRSARIIGMLSNDGPTRVFTFRYVSMSPKEPPDSAVLSHSLSSSDNPLDRDNGNNFAVQSPRTGTDLAPVVSAAIFEGAAEAERMLQTSNTPTEADIQTPRAQVKIQNADNRTRDWVISVRAAFSELLLSFVDASPSEIAVATFSNVNAIASWDTQRVINSTVYITLSSLQVDNMLPNAPFPVALCPIDMSRGPRQSETNNDTKDELPLLVIGVSVEPKHSSGIECLKSVTIAPRDLSINVDLAFLVRLQKFALDLQQYFSESAEAGGSSDQTIALPDIKGNVAFLEAMATSSTGRKKFHFGSVTILPFNMKLSVAPARALSSAQAALEGQEAAEIHQAVRKGDLLLNKKEDVGVLRVKIGSRNKTPLMVVRGMFKSFVVDGLLRLDGASLMFAGVSLRNHTATSQQLSTALGAHYFSSLRNNLPALVGSMAAFGNPLGLARGLGEGVGDFVLEPVRGFQRSVQEMDASHLVDGVARGTVSLARHTVGGFADSAAMLAETFSKNMTVLTLDRRYAQKRDRGEVLRELDDLNVASGLGSGAQKLVLGFLDGVTGVVKAPIRGAEKRGLEGFAKGIGKGLLGLLVKPMIGISDGFTDVMIGVKGSVDGNSTTQRSQVRPRRALYGRDKAIRVYCFADAAASALMLRTRLAGEQYLGHYDMGDRVALLSVQQLVILGRQGNELLVLKFKHIESIEVRSVEMANGEAGWSVIVLLNTPRKNGSEVEVIMCSQKSHADSLCVLIEHGWQLAQADRRFNRLSGLIESSSEANR